MSGSIRSLQLNGRLVARLCDGEVEVFGDPSTDLACEVFQLRDALAAAWRERDEARAKLAAWGPVIEAAREYNAADVAYEALRDTTSYERVYQAWLALLGAVRVLNAARERE